MTNQTTDFTDFTRELSDVLDSLLAVAVDYLFPNAYCPCCDTDIADGDHAGDSTLANAVQAALEISAKCRGEIWAGD